MKIHHGWRDSVYGPVHIGLTDKGVCWIGLARLDELFEQAREESENRMRIHFPRAEFVVQSEGLPDVDPPAFLPLDLHGTAFQQRVWAELLALGPGETRTYGDIARAIGQPKAVRAVGGAVGANPVSVLVPCHRILPKGGGIGNYGWGANLKQKILEIEGVRV